MNNFYLAGKFINMESAHNEGWQTYPHCVDEETEVEMVTYSFKLAQLQGMVEGNPQVFHDPNPL